VAGSGWTSLVIDAERGLRAVDNLPTGWLEPGRPATLQLLEAAAGEELLGHRYLAAFEQGYRWHELGDSHLILLTRGLGDIPFGGARARTRAQPTLRGVEVVLGIESLAAAGGSQTYIVTVAEQLERLGHAVTLRVIDRGPMAEHARERGLRVVGENGGLTGCDVALVLDGPSAYGIKEDLPQVPQVLVGMSDGHDLQLPPLLDGVVSCTVALSDRVAARLRAVDPNYEVVRLRQPVDTQRFVPTGALPARPRRALLLSNYLSGPRRRRLLEAWSAAGIECVCAGEPSAATLTPEQLIATSDIVVGKGRVILEAMACGRAAYLYDFAGCDGWVTPANYPALEADAFGGQATAHTGDRASLVGDLALYDPAMGDANRDLASARHGARAHAHALVELFERLAPRAEPVAAPLRELARLVRQQWRAEGNLTQLHAILDARVSELDNLHAEHGRVVEALADARAQAGRLAEQRDELIRSRASVRAELTETQTELSRIQALLDTRRARAGLAVGRAADRLRGIAHDR
jgi:hypothetical protein